MRCAREETFARAVPAFRDEIDMLLASRAGDPGPKPTTGRDA
jgi:hypothetical protein